MNRDRAAASRAAGVWGEKLAEQELKKKGYRILGRRVRVGDRDELDLVARDGDVLVFVEVKTRETETFGRPFSAVDRAKRHVQSRAAVRYLKELKHPPAYFRFDVVEVIGSREAGATVHHVEDAFSLDRCYTIPC